MKKDIISSIKKVLQDEGFRFTKQRKAVWDELENSNDHHDADKIYENIKLKNLSVSRATVYRTLDLQDKIAKKHGYKVIRHTHQLFVKPIKE